MFLDGEAEKERSGLRKWTIYGRSHGPLADHFPNLSTTDFNYISKESRNLYLVNYEEIQHEFRVFLLKNALTALFWSTPCLAVSVNYVSTQTRVERRASSYHNARATISCVDQWDVPKMSPENIKIAGVAP